MKKILYNPRYAVNKSADEGFYFSNDLGEARRADGNIFRKFHQALSGGGITLSRIAKESTDIKPDIVLEEARRAMDKGLIIEESEDGVVGFDRLFYHSGSHSDFESRKWRQPRSLSNRLKVQDCCIGAFYTDDLTRALTVTRLPSNLDSLNLVFVDSIFDNSLLQLAFRYRKAGIPWMFVSLRGYRIAVSPVFDPGRPGCYRCVYDKLKHNFNTLFYIARKCEVPICRTLPIRCYRIENIISQIEFQLARYNSTDQPNELSLYDCAKNEYEYHPVISLPYCDCCGQPEDVANLRKEPPHTLEHVDLVLHDGGLRSRSADDVLPDLEPYVSDVTGVVRNLMPAVPRVDGLEVYYAGENLAVPASNIAELRQGLRSACAGKGYTRSQAKVSAIGEAMERFCGTHSPELCTPDAVSKASDLGDRCFPPQQLGNYSDRQYADREKWNSLGVHYAYIPPKYRDEVIEWTKVYSIIDPSDTRYVPSSGCWYNYPNSVSYLPGDSNGCASGSNYSEAIVQGLLEIVERDSVAIWWYNKLMLPEINISSFKNKFFDRWAKKYSELGRHLWVLDATLDTRIPCAVAVSADRRTNGEILFAFGAHPVLETAVSRAISEMNQFVSGLLSFKNGNELNQFDPLQLRWWKTEKLDSNTHLLPSSCQPTTSSSHRENPQLKTLDGLVRQVVESGFSPYVLDQSRPDVPLKVTKVFVPGMYHFWPRFYGDRLYNLPVRLGLREEPLSEQQLNQFPMFL